MLREQFMYCYVCVVMLREQFMYCYFILILVFLQASLSTVYVFAAFCSKVVLVQVVSAVCPFVITRVTLNCSCNICGAL
jgi:hypothetical protein